MQAIERLNNSHDWITLVFVFLLVLLFVLKNINPMELKGYAKAYFLKGFVEEKTTEKASFFTVFNLLLFLFFTVVVSFFLLSVLPIFRVQYSLSFSLFAQVFLLVIAYFSLLLFFEYLLVKLLDIQSSVRYFILGKLSYLYTAALWLFPVLVMDYYSFSNPYLSAGIFTILIFINCWLIFTNNKNLILNKLFYFILYLCALKITPLLVLFKLTA